MSKNNTLILLALLISTKALADTPAALNQAVKSLAPKAYDLPPLYKYAMVDLNDDATDDAVVVLLEGEWCGSRGCTLAVFRGGPEGFTFLSKTPGVREPISVLAQKNEGWHSLSVLTAGGGATPANSLVSFSGVTYSVLQEKVSSEMLNSGKQLQLATPEYEPMLCSLRLTNRCSEP